MKKKLIRLRNDFESEIRNANMTYIGFNQSDEHRYMLNEYINNDGQFMPVDHNNKKLISLLFLDILIESFTTHNNTKTI